MLHLPWVKRNSHEPTPFVFENTDNIFAEYQAIYILYTGRITVTTNNVRLLSVEAVKDALWGHPPDRQSLPVSETIVVRPVDIT